MIYVIVLDKVDTVNTHVYGPFETQAKASEFMLAYNNAFAGRIMRVINTRYAISIDLHD